MQIQVTDSNTEGFNALLAFHKVNFTRIVGEYAFFLKVNGCPFFCSSDSGCMFIQPLRQNYTKLEFEQVTKICLKFCPNLWMVNPPADLQSLVAMCGFTPVQTFNPVWVSTPGVRCTTKGLRAINHTQQ